MEYLIRRGVPQRTAHHLVGELVRKAMDRRCALADLPLGDFQSAHPELTDEVYQVLGVDKAVAAFSSFGSTAPAEVAKQVSRWQEKVAKEAHNTAGAT
jgi:argininosuccinate lyase